MIELNSLLKSAKFKLINVGVLFCLFLISRFRFELSSEGGNWESIIYDQGAYFLVLLLLSPSIGNLFISINHHPVTKQIRQHVIASLLFGILHFLLTGVMILMLERLFLLEEHYTLSSLLRYYSSDWILITDGIGWYLVYLMLIMLTYYYLLYKTEKQYVLTTKSDLKSSNIQVLSTQLSPHFIFNAMNSITMMVRKQENSQAVNMIASLSEMLRAAMSQKNQQLVPLKSELALLNKYLAIEKVRFKDRVEIELSFPDEILHAAVPQLVLQPLVENAFKHGVENSSGKTVVKVYGSKKKEQLNLSVFNSGQNNVHWDITNSKSLGLPNTIHRLRQLYGSDFNFKVIEQKEGVLFQTTIPFNTKFNPTT